VEWWQTNRYLYGRELSAGLWVCVAPMTTTLRLMVCDPGWVHEFWCYPYGLVPERYVLAAAEAFDGTGDPWDGWVKHHPSMRRNPRVRIDPAWS
jgi:hypothetical protein